MSQKFGTPIDLTGNVIKNAGIEVVSSLPTDFLVEGREVIFQGEVFRYLNGEWHINSFSAYSLKTYAELKALKDNNALVPGNQYVLTDFYTTYLAEDGETWLGGPDCEVIDHLGNPIVSDNYHIVLTAVSKNQFATNVSILNQVNSEKVYLHTMSKWAVQFNFDLDLFGRITFMYDALNNNTFDFDIFNIRWQWKGFQINLIPYSIDLTNFGGKLEPQQDFYLWTIGDLEMCFGTLFDPTEKYKNQIFYNISIVGSSHLFLYAQSKSIPSSYWSIYIFNANILRTQFLTAGKEVFNCSFIDCKHIYLRDWPNHSRMIQCSSIFTPFHARGLQLGFENGIDDDETCKFLSFFMQGPAFLVHDILVAKNFVALSKKSAFPISQQRGTFYPVFFNFAIINNNMSGTGGANVGVSFDGYSEDCEVEIPDLIDKSLNLSIKSMCFVRVSLPVVENLQLPNYWYQVISNNNNQVFLRYLDSNNQEINTELTDSTPINGTLVKFYEDYITSVNNSYYLPFCAFYSSATEWGYEIENIKYATSKTYPIYACFFMNTGSNTVAFAGKTLKFYVISNEITHYSNSYNINANNTLSLIKN